MHQPRDTLLPNATRLPGRATAYFVHQQTLNTERKDPAIKKLFLAAPLALAAASVLATPASAANWNNNAGKIRDEINQLDRQVDRARGLSQREEARLENQVDNLQALYQRYARNGISRAEASVLDNRIDQVRKQLFRQSNDRNGHNGRDGWNGHDGRGHR